MRADYGIPLDLESPARFRIIVDAMNAVFGKDYEGFQRHWLELDPSPSTHFERWKVWLPKIPTDGRSWDRKWLNTIDPVSADLTEVLLVDELRAWDSIRETRPRVTLGKSHNAIVNQDAFKFIGVYKAKIRDGNRTVYERIATSFMPVGFEGHGEMSPEASSFEDGAVHVETHIRYERNQKNREACIAAHGATCAVCGFDFERAYGELGKGYIQVHHLTPVSEMGGAHAVDPVKDLIPVCPNCHAMLHRRKPPIEPYVLQELIETHR